jgi:hypothetical protein
MHKSLSLLAAVTVALVGCAHHDVAAYESCIAKLHTIEGAKATWALENKKTDADIPADADLFGPAAYIRQKPQCPQGGVYTIGRVGDRPRCSIPGHTP